MTDLSLLLESSSWYCPQQSSHHSSDDFIGSSVICVRLLLNTAALRENQGPERHSPTNRASYMTEPNVLCLQRMSKRSSVCIDPRGGEGEKKKKIRNLFRAAFVNKTNIISFLRATSGFGRSEPRTLIEGPRQAPLFPRSWSALQKKNKVDDM